MAHYACVTSRGHQSFSPVVMYLTFLKHILQISRSCKVLFWNSQMQQRVYAKFLQNQNTVNISLGNVALRYFQEETAMTNA